MKFEPDPVEDPDLDRPAARRRQLKPAERRARIDRLEAMGRSASLPLADSLELERLLRCEYLADWHRDLARREAALREPSYA